MHWTRLPSLALLLVLLVIGCKTQPDLKPPKQPEVFNPPPASANLASYPKQAFANPNDPAKRMGLDPGRATMPSSTMPANFGGSGMGGMGGMGGPGGMGGMGGPR
jgi:hypothetical protein